MQPTATGHHCALEEQMGKPENGNPASLLQMRTPRLGKGSMDQVTWDILA